MSVERKYYEQIKALQELFESECSHHEETKTLLDKIKKIVLVDQYISFEDWQKLKVLLVTERRNGNE